MTTHVDVVVAFNILFFFFAQTGNILDKQKSYNGNITKDYSPRNHIHTQTKLKQDKHTPNNTKPKRGIAETKQNTTGSLLTATTPR